MIHRGTSPHQRLQLPYQVSVASRQRGRACAQRRRCSPSRSALRLGPNLASMLTKFETKSNRVKSRSWWTSSLRGKPTQPAAQATGLPAASRSRLRWPARQPVEWSTRVVCLVPCVHGLPSASGCGAARSFAHCRLPGAPPALTTLLALCARRHPGQPEALP